MLDTLKPLWYNKGRRKRKELIQMKVKVYVDWDSKEIYGSVDAAMSRLKEEYDFEQFISEEISPLELLRMTEEEAYERYYDYMMDEVNRIYYCIEVDIS